MSKIITVRKEGGSRCLALSPYIPSDWEYVSVTEIEKDTEKDSVTIKIDKVK